MVQGRWSGGDPSEESPEINLMLFGDQTLQLSKQGEGWPTPQSPPLPRSLDGTADKVLEIKAGPARASMKMRLSSLGVTHLGRP